MVAPIDHLIKSARQAIERDQPHEARTLLQQAAEQNPHDPRIWLLLAGIAASPRAREAYLNRAAALRQTDPALASTTVFLPAASQAEQSDGWFRWVVRAGALLLLVVLLLAGGTLLGAYLTGQPVAAFVANWLPVARLPQTTDPVLAAAEERAESLPAFADEERTVESLQPTPTLALSVVDTPVAVSDNNSAVPEEVAGADNSAETTANEAADVEIAPAVADNSLAKEIAADSQPRAAWTPTLAPTPTPEPTATPAPVVAGAPVRPAEVGTDERWIDVNLTTQTLVALEGNTPVLTSLISSGTWLHPTVTGTYRTYMKYESQTMNGYLLGYDYYLEGVPFVMYFYRDYAIHGTFWHNNFGTPMSHGCVNMNTADAGWLFHWAPVGTLVNVHY